ncbi:MAG: archease [Candidatus Auribacterota bacterium]|nr:archease [Candidatus Auribacterota bacterium]
MRVFLAWLSLLQHHASRFTFHSSRFTHHALLSFLQNSGYTIGNHPSDLELRIRAPDLKELFITATRAMLDYTAPLVTPDDPIIRQVHLTASDREELLVVWLNELLFLLETEEIYFRDITFTNLADRELGASLKGVKLQPIDERGPEIKEATYY